MISVAAYTLGCKVNQYDTEKLLEKCRSRGCRTVPFEHFAELYIINTCTVTHIADRKSRQMIRKAKKINPNARIAVCGCLAKLSPETVREAGADFVFDAREAESLFQNMGDSFSEPARAAAPARIRAYIKIQEGCDRFCAYCIVPYARGSVVSRPPADIIKEAEALTRRGVREIVLTGIHAASYGKDLIKGSLPALMEIIAGTDGLRRLRLSSIEPCAADEAFLRVIEKYPVICGHFHLSLQSGCDATLRRMNRRYTTAEYRTAAEALRHVRPDAALTTDIMVGFPGETDADFEESMAFIEQSRFARLHVFEFSPRANTPAANFPAQIPAPVKSKRGEQTRALAARLERGFLAAFTGRTEEVLFETERGGYLYGKTGNYISVRVKKPADGGGNAGLLNEIADVKLEAVTDGEMEGILIGGKK